MGAGKGGKGQIAKYLMSLHAGICMSGPGITLTGLYYGEKNFFTGTREALTSIPVDKTNLFGGRKKEGGLKGRVWWLPGRTEQVLPNELAQRINGKNGNQTPGFRGVATIMFTGNGTQGGFNFGANNPYLRPIWARVRRAPQGLNPNYALIARPDDPAQYDANPAHIIYEIQTNKDWGGGVPTAAFDTAAYEAVALQLYNEGFGISMLWTRQSEIEKIIAEVLDHIQAVIYTDPRTGLQTIKLLRGGYSVANLPEINPDNARLSDYQRKQWGETVNEVVVSWTNPATGNDATVTAQDLGLIATQGGIVSTTRNYYGVRHEQLAMKLANRDLAAAAAPLASCTAVLDRQLWDKLMPGAVVSLRWPEKGLLSQVMRVQKVNRGTPGSPTLTVSLIEDIFGLDYSQYLDTPSESPTPGDSEPQPVTQAALYTAPLYMTLQALGRATSSELPYPECITGVMALKTAPDDISFELVTPVMTPKGVAEPTSVGSLPFTGGAKLAAALPAAAVSTITSFDLVNGSVPADNSFIVIGDGSEANSEIALVTDVGVGGWTLRRGILDTIPRAWPIGTSVWTIPGVNSVDPTIRSENQTVSYRLLPATPVGELAWADAPNLTITLSKRPHRPFRPANIMVNGFAFTTVNLVAATDVNVTWANRNRNVELTVPLGWTDATVSPEVGQTTSVILQRAADNTIITQFDNLTGTSYTFPKTAFAGVTDAYVQVRSVREGLASLQSARIRVAL